MYVAEVLGCHKKLLALQQTNANYTHFIMHALMQCITLERHEHAPKYM